MPAATINMLDHADLFDITKHPRHLYVCQPHTIQIIQLVEGPPPPPPCPVESSTSSSSSSSSPCPTTSDSDEDGSSYCSSVYESSHDAPWTDDTYTTRMKRVHAWRETAATSLKRKTEDDAVSHTAKRARSRDHSLSRLTAHPCPACDTLFPSLASLRKHGRTPDSPEACQVAVEYNLES